MSLQINEVRLAGNLTRDPELRYTQNNTAVVQISVATNERWTDRVSGELREKAVFVDVEFWGQRAEKVAEFFRKGKPIYIEGRLDLDTWQDRDTGKTRSRLKVKGDLFKFVESRRDGGQQQQRAQGDHGGGFDSVPEDEVPF